jgi:hypothetical protein
MSARDDAHGGRFEPMVSTAARGEGLALVGRCDECMKPSPVRSQTKVLKGPLRGLRGMVCKTCKDARQAVPA